MVSVTLPAEEQAATRLGGQTPNPSGEEWERVGPNSPAPGFAAASVAELRVRNVSKPTLSAFLPTAAKATGAAMIVLPGGGFVELEIEREGYSVAKWLNERGIAAFVVKYRLAPTPVDPKLADEANSQRAQRIWRELPTAKFVSETFSVEQRDSMRDAQEDALEAIRYVRSHADQYGLSRHRIGIVGFSAGAITAIGVALKADEASRPDVVAPIYGALPDETNPDSTSPPAFIAVAADDILANRSLNIYKTWRAHGAKAELHILEDGGHGFGVLHQGRSSDEWLLLFDRWLASHGFETPGGSLE